MHTHEPRAPESSVRKPSTRSRDRARATEQAAVTSRPTPRAAAPDLGRAQTYGHRFGVGSAAAPVQCVSKFTDKNKRKGYIYTIRRKSDGKVEYVGQTVQKPRVRFKQHLDSKKWLSNKTHYMKVKRRGHYTPFRLTAYEQHYIDRYGGKSKLRNRVDAMTRKKYLAHKHMHKSLGSRSPY
jgi:hypothetical protein